MQNEFGTQGVFGRYPQDRTMQLSLELIPHRVGREVIQQRAKDGYINAAAMCKAAGKLWADYRRLKITGEFCDALSSDMGIPIAELIQSVTGEILNSKAHGPTRAAEPKFGCLKFQTDPLPDFGTRIQGFMCKKGCEA